MAKKSAYKNKPAVSRTGKWKSVFIEALKETGIVGRAAEKASVGRSTVYLERECDEEFAEQWEEALECHVETLEAEADRRAVQGTGKPVFFQGLECGTIQEYSDTLLIFRLKALAPEKYRERMSVDINYKQQFELFVAKHKLTKEQIEANPVYRAAAARWGIMGISAGGGAERNTKAAG